MAWLGPGLAPARAVSTAAGLLAAVVIGLAARRRAKSNLAGLLAGGFFLASPYVFHTTPLARVNGATLLFSLVGLSLFEVPTRRRVALGTLALLAALFTKQTAVDAALACLLSTLLVSPRRAIAAALALAGLGFASLAALSLATRGAFWLNVVSGNANPFDAAQLIGYLSNFVSLHGAILALAAVEVVVSVWRRAWSPWVFYFPTSLALALGVGKWGAGESYFLDAIAAACVLSAAQVARLVQSGGVGERASGREPFPASPTLPLSHSLRIWLLGAALLTQGLLLAHGPLMEVFPILRDQGPQASLLGRAPSPADRSAGEEIVAMIQRVRGPALVEDPSFAVSAGKPVVGNATHLRNLHQAGLWDPTSLVAELKARRYDIVVLNAQLYPEPVLEAIGRAYYRYRTVRMNGYIYQVFLPGSE
jgi:hypothetical protein